MSWAEVKKINSDLSTPINIANLINHIDLVGDNYDGLDDLDTLAMLLSSNALYSHQVALQVAYKVMIDYSLNALSGVGSFINTAFGLNVPSLNTCSTYNDVLNNADACIALSQSPRFINPMIYFNAATFNALAGTNYPIFNHSRDVLLENINLNAAWCDLLRTTGFAKHWADNFCIQKFARENTNYAVPSDRLILAVGIGAGQNGGPSGYYEGGYGGAGGQYVQKIISAKASDVIDTSVSTSGTISTYLGINFGIGGGAAGGAYNMRQYGAAPSQINKIVPVSGGGAPHWDGGDASGGGGGYGGGNGGTPGGGTGPSFFNLVAGTGGGGGSAVIAGGGGGSGGTYSGGGGGGYGGGGGGANYRYGPPGLGGTGGIALFY